MIDALKPYLGHIDGLMSKSSDGKADYIHPALRNLGSVSIVLVREIVAPAIFRNQEDEITDITVGERQFVRAVPNKFKFRERGKGLQILRHYGAGGNYAQNRHAIPEKTGEGKNSVPFPVSEAFDMNSLVFGDSANQGSKVLPVKAAVLYSDGLSLCDYQNAVGKSFHNRASEDGTLFDAAKKANSSNLFERHFVLPGTLMVQVISTNGRTLPVEGLEHLLLSLGEAGAYGGQTSVTGVNVRNHIVGIYASLSEHEESSPYTLAKKVSGTDIEDVAARLHDIMAKVHEVAIPRKEAEAYRSELLEELHSDAPRLRNTYTAAHSKVGALFDHWFTGK
jgi:CRISPR-associated protein Csc2